MYFVIVSGVSIIGLFFRDCLLLFGYQRGVFRGGLFIIRVFGFFRCVFLRRFRCLLLCFSRNLWCFLFIYRIIFSIFVQTLSAVHSTSPITPSISYSKHSPPKISPINSYTPSPVSLADLSTTQSQAYSSHTIKSTN